MHGWIDASEEEVKMGIAIGLLFEEEDELTAFFFAPECPRLRKRAGILRDEIWTFDTLRQSVVRTALDIWSGSGHVYLHEMLENWDRETWVKFLKAVCVLKSINPSLLIDDTVPSPVNLWEMF